MKKYGIIMFSLLLLIPIQIGAEEKIAVTLNQCVDGDTAWFNVNDEKIKTRFLAIDTPESTNKIEAYGKEASEFTCSLLKKAKTIEIEYDPNSEKLDKYQRHLVWVFVDDHLLQEEIIENGLGEVAYLYDNYKYTSILEQVEEIAKQNQVGMWSTEEKDNFYFYLALAIMIVVIIYLIFPKKRKKIQSKIKSTIKKEIKKKIS